MIWDKFKDHFHESWHHKMKPFVESKEMDKIYDYLKTESKRGVRILPDSFNTFRAFKETKYNDINAVLLGYCPYHIIYNGIPAADGLMFSCSITGKLQPSLHQFYRALEKEFYDGLNLHFYWSPDLSYLAKQGILLLNSSLTTEYQKPGKHQQLWEPFTKYVIEECLSYLGVPIVLIGKDAQYYERYMSPLTHGYIFELEHPAAAARNLRDWETDKVFTKVSHLVKMNNGIDIKWLCKEEEVQQLIKD
jgi:uracil-DNA glycosylase